MAQKTVFVPEIGELILSKRRGTTHIRLSINAAGKVRVGLPYWAPYQAGVAFAKSKADWISKNRSSHSTQILKEGDLIGKSHRLNFIQKPNQKSTTVKINTNTILISSPLEFNHPEVQKRTISASEKALKAEAEHLLPQRLQSLAKKHNFSYKNVQIKKLTSRWGSCSSHKVITLSYYLMQLPWHLIDYVIVHELVHTRQMHHGKEFWDDFKKIMPNAKLLQKEIKTYKPLVQAYKIIPSK
jgi:predicted metal-dependent hydrolase